MTLALVEGESRIESSLARTCAAATFSYELAGVRGRSGRSTGREQGYGVALSAFTLESCWSSRANESAGQDTVAELRDVMTLIYVDEETVISERVSDLYGAVHQRARQKAPYLE